MTRRTGLLLVSLLGWSAIVAALGAAVGTMAVLDRLAPVSGSLFVCEAFGALPG
jgi:hypothetical protein